ncbi:hypothetical protein PROFUN_07736 [Planoprotostelium fungivorum]|uniref:Uncharacterized protein n=1 Tax=Planoprotostelium fungivorum TaxID=1890364 RepID=A0A2P6N1F7_9EUKA|nr:hypothetical protein PROFUN_07736 [Planoprotostelium fungivorum]
MEDDVWENYNSFIQIAHNDQEAEKSLLKLCREANTKELMILVMETLSTPTSDDSIGLILPRTLQNGKTASLQEAFKALTHQLYKRSPLLGQDEGDLVSMDSKSVERTYNRQWSSSSRDDLRSAMALADVIVRDATLPPKAHEISREFLGHLLVLITSHHGRLSLEDRAEDHIGALQCLSSLERSHELSTNGGTLWSSEFLESSNSSVQFSVYHWTILYAQRSPKCLRPQAVLQRVLRSCGRVLSQSTLASPSITLIGQLCLLSLDDTSGPQTGPNVDASTEFLEHLINFMVHCPSERLRTAGHNILCCFIDVRPTYDSFSLMDAVIHRCPYPSVQCAILYQYKRKLEENWNQLSTRESDLASDTARLIEFLMDHDDPISQYDIITATLNTLLWIHLKTSTTPWTSLTRETKRETKRLKRLKERVEKVERDLNRPLEEQKREFENARRIMDAPTDGLIMDVDEIEGHVGQMRTNMMLLTTLIDPDTDDTMWIIFPLIVFFISTETVTAACANQTTLDTCTYCQDLKCEWILCNSTFLADTCITKGKCIDSGIESGQFNTILQCDSTCDEIKWSKHCDTSSLFAAGGSISINGAPTNLSTGAKVGIFFGVTIGAGIIIAGLVWFFVIRRRRGYQDIDLYQ